LLFGGSLLLAATSPSAIKLVDVAAEAGITLLNVHGDASKDYIVDTNGNGAAFFDYDNDNNLDVLLVNGSTREHLANGGDPMVALYHNDGKAHFTDVTARSGMTRRGWGMGTCVADIDNDGFDDVYVTAFGPNVLYHNNGNGTFTDVTARAGVGDPHWSTGCAFGDYNRDGYVDLFVANYVDFDQQKIPKRGASAGCRYMGADVFCGPRGLPTVSNVLYRNNGDGTFTDVTQSAGIKDKGSYGFGVLFSDFDEDGWPDIFVANDSVPSTLFRNNHDGTFTERGLASGLALSGDGRAQAGMGVDAGDYDGDGHLDLIVTHFSEDYHTLYENSGKGLFTDVSYRAGVAVPPLRYMGWGVGFFDVDNDGRLDIFAANGHVYPEIDRFGGGTRFLQRKQLFLNLGNKRFREVGAEAGTGMAIEKSSRGAAFGDFDNDGDVDVLVVNMNDRPTLLRNETSSANHWITIRTVGAGRKSGVQASNRDGIGARVRVTAGGRTQIAEVRSGGSYLSHNDARVHFGLGDAARVDRVEIMWPSGSVDRATDLAANRFYIAQEGGSVSVVRAGAAR
jgi:hypothetical protein